jgi:hypothetical protein
VTDAVKPWMKSNIADSDAVYLITEVFIAVTDAVKPWIGSNTADSDAVYMVADAVENKPTWRTSP